MSQVTTHILDTSKGKPAQGVNIILEMKIDNAQWKLLGKGETNSDGRLPGLLAPDVKLNTGTYRLVFDTASYFKNQNIEGFYPSVTIDFIIKDESHYHVPLLLNPFGYSTYRGS